MLSISGHSSGKGSERVRLSRLSRCGIRRVMVTNVGGGLPGMLAIQEVRLRAHG
jgi:hypothetical protein